MDSDTEPQLRAEEELDESVEIFEGDSDFDVSPTKNVHPDLAIQDDEVDVEVKDA